MPCHMLTISFCYMKLITEVKSQFTTSDISLSNSIALQSL